MKKQNLNAIKNCLGLVVTEFKTPEKIDLCMCLVQNLIAASIYTDRYERAAALSRSTELFNHCQAVAPRGSNFMAEAELVLDSLNTMAQLKGEA